MNDSEYYEDQDYNEEDVDYSETVGGELEQQFKCQQCGAKMQFVPGSLSQVCPYCEHENPIPQSAEDIEELDFYAYLHDAAGQEEMEERLTIKCEACAAESTFDANLTSHQCPFCGMDIVATAKSKKLIKPKSLLPFRIARKKAQDLFRKWIQGLWFAPTQLKKIALQDKGLNGMYVPYWTYDTDTTTYYTGMRGTYYYVTESYRDSEGKMKTRQVRKIRWRPASGTVWRSFDDVLIIASKSLPKKYAQKLEPWDLQNLEPYRDEFLSGFQAESYQIDLGGGFEKAKGRMAPQIDSDIRGDIGGDEQRITTKNTSYANITFKHTLLPIWISAYFYKDKSYRFLVNGRTGKVQGERPWDYLKIALTAGGIIALIAIIAKLGGAF